MMKKQAPTDAPIARRFGKWLFTILLLRREDWLARGAAMHPEAAYVAKWHQWIYPFMFLFSLLMIALEEDPWSNIWSNILFGALAVTAIVGYPFLLTVARGYRLRDRIDATGAVPPNYRQLYEKIRALVWMIKYLILPFLLLRVLMFAFTGE